jgi:transposase InsO family protein
MPKKVNSITELVSDTPIVKLNRVVQEGSATVWCKSEYYNPVCSVKDRIGLNRIVDAEVTALLRSEGWRVKGKRVERIWRQEGLKVPQRQPRRRRLWFNDGSCIRLRPMYRNHVWSYDFLLERTTDGKPMRMLTIIDEYTRECLAIHIGREIKATEVFYRLSELFVLRGAPEYIRSDNGSEFTSQMVREWLQRLGVKTLFIEPGSPMGERVHRIIQRRTER